MLVFGLETSCDETSAAFVEDDRILANIVSSQAKLHERFGGVVPEIACRAHLETILPVLKEAEAQAARRISDCACIAVTNRPGLIGPLLVGVTAAKALAFVHDLPIVPVDHLHAHLYALRMAAPACAKRSAAGRPACLPVRAGLARTQTGAAQGAFPVDAAGRPDAAEPMAALLVSGGHTALYRIDWPLGLKKLAETVDDAAGESFDKVAKLLGLGYPGGPLVEQLARQGNPRAVAFPRAHLDDPARFSFSGLKTAVLYRVKGYGAKAGPQTPGDAAPPDGREKSDIAASFQEAVVDLLARKTVEAARREGVRSIGVAGGVAANGPLRERLGRLAAENGLRLILPPLALCTDNAAMVAGLGGEMFRAGRAAPLDFDAFDEEEIRK